jgi:tRNA nucleotidyltransferase (CCA-adding enzyme)
LLSLFPPVAHERIFLVGGTVRDILLEQPSKDIDLVAVLSSQEMKDLGFRRVQPRSAVPIYFQFHLSLGKIEVTTIESCAALEADLRRRDVTVNAMALTLTGTFLDPLDGCPALQCRELRACSDEAFSMDPVRIFRVFRFEADGWRLTPATEELIRDREWNEALRLLPTERFSGEMLKALAAAEPGWFFRRMIEFEVGRQFLPEIFRMKKVPAGPVEHHPEGDLLTHSLQVLERVCVSTSDVVTRFCALFHDLGKLETLPELYPKHHGHDEAGFRTARSFCDRLALSVTFRTALSWVNRLHTTAGRWGELRTGTKIKLAEQAVRGGITDILSLVAAADKPDGTGMSGWERAVRIVQLSTPELGIDPRLLAAVPLDGIVPLSPEQRPALIHQRRVEMFRAVSDIKNESPRENRLSTSS